MAAQQSTFQSIATQSIARALAIVNAERETETQMPELRELDRQAAILEDGLKRCAAKFESVREANPRVTGEAPPRIKLSDGDRRFLKGMRIAWSAKTKAPRTR